MSAAPIAKYKRFGQDADPLEISAGVVQPYSVSELESQGRRLFPGSEADVSLPGVDVRVVNFRPAGIPDLECLLDLLISNQKADMSKSNDPRVDRIITRGRRLRCQRRHCRKLVPL